MEEVASSTIAPTVAAAAVSDRGAEARGGDTLEIDDDQSLLGLLLLVSIVVASQGVLLLWENRHKKSYVEVTLLALWIIPCLVSMRNGFARFILIWLIYSVASIFVLIRAGSSPTPRYAPSLVYGWFRSMHGLCYTSTLLGLFSMLIGVLPGVGISFLFYGLYFGVLSRDLADRATARLAVRMGYYTEGKDSISKFNLRSNVCAVCGELIDSDTQVTAKPSCGHLYHDSCLRGWALIGKKDTCAYCKEKVDLGELCSNPWHNQSLQWSRVLDTVRYLVAWNPIVFTIANAALRFTGLVHLHSIHEH